MLRGTYLLVGAVVLVLAGSSMSYAQDEIVNMLTNPDFDDNTNGWSLSAMNGNELIIMDDDQGVLGPYAWAKIKDVGPDPWNPEIHSPSFSVKNGAQYTVAFWAKTEETKTRQLQVKFEQLETWTGPSTNILVSDQWTEYDFSPTMTMGSPPAVVVHIAFNLDKTDVWFDHFRVYKGEYVEEEGFVFGEPQAVQPEGKLATSWAKVKRRAQ